MIKKTILMTLSSLVLSGCFIGDQDFPVIGLPGSWSAHNADNIDMAEARDLKRWWEQFDDHALNVLIDTMLADSPDRKLAEARIVEARGLKRSAVSTLFPQIGISAIGGRQDIVFSPDDSYYEASFDASYELDIFGKNRKNVSAAQARMDSLEAEYHDITLTLIAEVARTYIVYRAFEKQSAIAQKNLSIQEQTLKLIRQQFEIGESPRLDVERAENIVNTTKSSIPNFERQAHSARLQLSVLTGQLPEDVLRTLSEPADIPAYSVQPVLMTPVKILSQRPDIRAASANLAANTALAESATAELFPSFTLSSFYGITENVLTSSTAIWNVALGAGVALLDFGQIEGRIDAARGREMQSFQLYRKTLLEAIIEVETAISDTAYINAQRVSLQNAYNNAERAFKLSETLYKEGEISFLDVLDAQRTVNEADSALITAQAAQAESVVRLYKSLGIY